MLTLREKDDLYQLLHEALINFTENCDHRGITRQDLYAIYDQAIDDLNKEGVYVQR